MSKSKPEPTTSNNVVTVVGEEGADLNNRVMELVTESLTQARSRGRVVQCGTNLDVNTFAGKALMLKASGPGDYELRGEEPLRMTVYAYAVFPDTQEDEESGEIKEFTRTVLFDRDGKTFRTTASHGPTRLLIACALFTPAQWQSGIPFVIRARMGKRGRVYHDIQIDTDNSISV